MVQNNTYQCLEIRNDNGDKKRITASTIHVVKGNYGSLLSYQTANELNVIQVNNNINFADNDKSPVQKKIEKKFPCLFHGIGKLHNFEAKLHINSSVPPVAQPARRIPYHSRRKVSAALKQLENGGIIEKVEAPTPWMKLSFLNMMELFVFVLTCEWLTVQLKENDTQAQQ